MRSHPWNCLKARQQLAANATPAFGWDYSYTLPTQCVRLMTVNGHDNDTGNKEDFYEIEGRDILTDANECKITYIKYSDNTPIWDPLLRLAVVIRLASKLAHKISQDHELGFALLQTYEKQILRQAQKIDSNERKKAPYNPVKDSKWIAARSIQPG